MNEWSGKMVGWLNEWLNRTKEGGIFFYLTKEGMFYLMMHSTHFMYGYMVSVFYLTMHSLCRTYGYGPEI